MKKHVTENTKIVRITPEELIEKLLWLDDGEKLDIGAPWDDGVDDVRSWHGIVNITSTVKDAFGDMAPTFLIGYYASWASSHVFCYDNTDHEGSVETLTELLDSEDLLYSDGTVCVEVPSEE